MPTSVHWRKLLRTTPIHLHHNWTRSHPQAPFRCHHLIPLSFHCHHICHPTNQYLFTTTISSHHPLPPPHTSTSYHQLILTVHTTSSYSQHHYHYLIQLSPYHTAIPHTTTSYHQHRCIAITSCHHHQSIPRYWLIYDTDTSLHNPLLTHPVNWVGVCVPKELSAQPPRPICVVTKRRAGVSFQGWGWAEDRGRGW